MTADEQTRAAVLTLIEQTYDAMSTPGSNLADLFGAPDIAIAGSGQGELWNGPDAIAAASVVSSWGFRWTAGEVTVWRRGDVAWAQILGSVRVVREGGGGDDVPYWTTGVFGLEDGRWTWLYWGGSEPQESPRL